MFATHSNCNIPHSLVIKIKPLVSYSDRVCEAPMMRQRDWFLSPPLSLYYVPLSLLLILYHKELDSADLTFHITHKNVIRLRI